MHIGGCGGCGFFLTWTYNRNSPYYMLQEQSFKFFITKYVHKTWDVYIHVNIKTRAYARKYGMLHTSYYIDFK